jgi:Xaa-Pro aminopeptidase
MDNRRTILDKIDRTAVGDATRGRLKYRRDRVPLDHASSLATREAVPQVGAIIMSEISDSVLLERRVRVARALPIGDGILLVGAGEPIPLPEGSDQTYPFRSHSEYLHLAGRECVGGVVAFDPQDGDRDGWVAFVPRVTEAERVWEGRGQEQGVPIEELATWLAARRDRPIALLGAPLQKVIADARLSAHVREALTHARRIKDSHEIALIRRAAAATAAGFARLREMIRPGISERALQIELEAEFFRTGATRPGYGSIVGSGRNAAVLHFEPSSRELRSGEFVLVDAGAEVGRYTADVTRTYVVETPTAFQRDLYDVVLAAQLRAIDRCVAGAEWKDIHLRSAIDLVDGLIGLGVMKGMADSLVAREAHTLFYPHGLGHMVGLGVRDGSGLLPGRQKDPRPALRTLRMDLPLAPGYVVTVEPGLYFIPPLLNDPERRARFRDCVNWGLVEEHLGSGGIRIEDNILVTEGVPEVLTREIPKTL